MWPLIFLTGLLAATVVRGQDTPNCPGYKATNIQNDTGGCVITADLTLNGNACNIYGTDLPDLRLKVEYQTAKRLHVMVYDAAEQVYQIPESVVPVPSDWSGVPPGDSELFFTMTSEPFSFAVTRVSNGEVLFNTSGSPLVFETQYLYLRTQLPANPNIYGFGEQADPFRHDPANYNHTFWNAGEGGLPENANLYGSHPLYFDHRGSKGTSAVFLRNSNGMLVNMRDDPSQSLEYNTLGGVIDLYFLSGPSPKDVSTQYAEIVGFPALMPYWGFGFHQCRYGMQDVYEVAGVVANYSTADIPLETMWTDIDYMDYRRVFSLDPIRFPLDKMRQFVDHLHSSQQQYIVMVDPAVAAYDYQPFNDGVSANAFLELTNGSLYEGVVWPGPAVFPDWFADGTQAYWDAQFGRFFDPNSGIDVDGLWIDMNEAYNFCNYPCGPVVQDAIEEGDPPRPPPARMYSPYAVPGFPADFQPGCFVDVTFNLAIDNGTLANGEVVLLMGDALSIGQNMPHDSPQMNGGGSGWNLVVQLPAKTTVEYQYPQYENNGTYIFEAHNRSLTTGACGSAQSVSDTLDISVASAPAKIRRAGYLRDHSGDLQIRQSLPADAPGSMQGLPNRNLVAPPFNIGSVYGALSTQTIATNVYHSNGLVEYDTHNLYGTMMSTTSRGAMLSRRPGLRPLVITRSTFAGAGRNVGHWFGDNVSTWQDYQISIRSMLEFVALFQIPMVGSDVCGFNGNTYDLLCARWAMLGAFYPFFRNHDMMGALPQEFYRWPLVAESAKSAISTRYRLLDYIYTALHTQNTTGTPMINPLFFNYPDDEATFAIDLQFFYGESVLVCPVTEENATSVTFYLPDDQFYDLYSYQPVRGAGANVTLNDVPFTAIPAYIRGGTVLPLRAQSANTTAQLRQQDFALVIAPGLNGTANGTLYLDDGESLDPGSATSLVQFTYSADGTLTAGGKFGYNPGVVVSSVTLLGVKSASAGCVDGVYNATAQSVVYQTKFLLIGGFLTKVGGC